MKSKWIIQFLLILWVDASLWAQSEEKHVLNEEEEFSGYYLAVEPESDTIEGVLILIAGFGQRPEDVFLETKLEQVAFENNVLTIAFAAGNKLYADSVTRYNLSLVIKDILIRYKTDPTKFVIGGFSAGGMIALRYVELCNEFPDSFPIQPKGVFTVDSPIDIFTIYKQLEQSLADNYSPIAVEEAQRALKYIRDDYGVPEEHIPVYAALTAFSMNKAYGENERFLKNVAVRTYHDVDIAWRIINRNQTVHNSNYEVTAELINRLVLMGNHRAEFMQSFKTGYRSNGQRHPHSWSIVDEVECIEWIKKLW
jgi:pimeloyl-ACP methyl ester carboxylesterase